MSDLYPSARERALTTGLNWASGDIRIVLVDSGYVYDSTHDFLNDVGAGTRVATSASLTGKTTTGGVADASDVTFVGLAGDAVAGIIVYEHTGVESTSPLICFYDRNSTGSLIAYTPSGVDTTVRWNNGSTKMFKV